MEDGSGAYVDPLRDLGVLVPEELHAEEATRRGITREVHGDAMASGVVSLVVVCLGPDGDRVKASSEGLVIAQAGAGHGIVEDFDHLGAETPGKGTVAAEGVLARYPPLLVGGGPERQVGFPEEAVMSDNAVASSENVREVCPHLPVDGDRAAMPQSGAGRGRKLGIGSYPYRCEHHVDTSGHLLAVGSRRHDVQSTGFTDRAPYVDPR